MDNEQFKFGQALRHRTGLFGSMKDNLKKFYLFVIKNFEVDNICVMTLLFEGRLQFSHYRKILINYLKLKKKLHRLFLRRNRNQFQKNFKNR